MIVFAQDRRAFTQWAMMLAPAVLLAGLLSAALAGNGNRNPWFASLVKPPLNPPPGTFAVVWSILYLMMGVALAMVITARDAPGRRRAIWAFGLQLLLNLAWSPLFFAAHHMAAALLLLVIVDLAALVCAVLFARVRPMAAALLVPYLAWAVFATVLNWQFMVYNPHI